MALYRLVCAFGQWIESLKHLHRPVLAQPGSVMAGDNKINEEETMRTRHTGVLVTLVLVLLVSGCASFTPHPLEEVGCERANARLRSAATLGASHSSHGGQTDRSCLDDDPNCCLSRSASLPGYIARSRASLSPV